MVVERFGHLDILVNNAGVFVGGTVDNPENNLAGFDRQVSINVGGVMELSRSPVGQRRIGGCDRSCLELPEVDFARCPSQRRRR